MRRATRADAWLLDLGDVREAARVQPQWQARSALPGPALHGAHRRPLKPRGNVLEIEVSNLPANRIRDLDVRKVDWKIMKDINLVSLSYAKFDAVRLGDCTVRPARPGAPAAARDS